MTTSNDQNAKDFNGVNLTAFRYGRTKERDGKLPRFYTYLEGEHNGQAVGFITYNLIAIRLANHLRMALPEGTDTPDPAIVRDGAHASTDVSGIVLDIKNTGSTSEISGTPVHRFNEFSPAGATADIEAALAAYKAAVFKAYTGTQPENEDEINIEILSESEPVESAQADEPVAEAEEPTSEPVEDAAVENTEAPEASEASEDATTEEADAPAEEAEAAQEETPEPVAEEAPEEAADAPNESEEKEFGSEDEKPEDFQETDLNLEAEEKPAEPEADSAPAAKPKSRRFAGRRGASKPASAPAEKEEANTEAKSEVEATPAAEESDNSEAKPKRTSRFGARRGGAKPQASTKSEEPKAEAAPEQQSEPEQQEKSSSTRRPARRRPVARARNSSSPAPGMG